MSPISPHSLFSVSISVFVSTRFPSISNSLLYISLFLSFFLSFSLSLSFNISLSLSVSLSPFLSILSPSLFLSPSLPLSSPLYPSPLSPSLPLSLSHFLHYPSISQLYSVCPIMTFIKASSQRLKKAIIIHFMINGSNTTVRLTCWETAYP